MAKTYIALENIRHNGQRFAPNDDIELDDKAAKQLLELNAVKAKVAVKAAPKAEPKEVPEAAQKEAPAANTGKAKAKAKAQ